MKRALVVGRQRRGKHNGRIAREVRDTLRRGGWKADYRVVFRKRDLRRLAARAARDGKSLVVVVGGDGAVRSVATSLAGTDVALGIIPTGTGNLAAGNLGIPRKVDAAARVLLRDGRRRRIDVGRVAVDGRERIFTVACGIGFDADVMEATQPRQKMRWGRLAYLANALARASGIRDAVHEIELDGKPVSIDAAQLFVANFGSMLPVVKPRRAVKPDDGLLDVIAIRGSGPLPAALAGWEALRQKRLGRSAGGRAFRARARKIRIETTPARLVEIDGSVVGTTPLVATVVPDSLTVMVPRR